MDSTQVVHWVSTFFQAYSAQIAFLSLIVAGISLYFNYRQVKAGETSANAAETSADMAERMFKESYRPEIQIRLTRAVGGISSKGTIGLYIDNLGSMPSKNIKITITPKLNISFNENQIPFEEKFKQFKVEGNSHILNYDFINAKSSISEYLERSVFVNPDDTTQEYFHLTTHTFDIEFYGLSELEENEQNFKSTFTCSINTLLNMNQIL